MSERFKNEVHFFPDNDEAGHSFDGEDECLCDPWVESVFRSDGAYGWAITHHRLDGRIQ